MRALHRSRERERETRDACDTSGMKEGFLTGMKEGFLTGTDIGYDERVHRID